MEGTKPSNVAFSTRSKVAEDVLKVEPFPAIYSVVVAVSSAAK
jgi:hypothetical protein